MVKTMMGSTTSGPKLSSLIWNSFRECGAVAACCGSREDWTGRSRARFQRSGWARRLRLAPPPLLINE
jgi:hypothetical protein